MCCVEYAPFDKTFVPTPKQVSFLKGIIVGTLTHEAGDGREFSVFSGWIGQELPSPRHNTEALMAAGYLVCVSEQYDGAVFYGLTEEAVDWCEANGVIPARALREADSAWISALTFDRKTTRTRGLTRNGSSPKVVRTTSEFVRQVSYTPEEAAGAHDEIDAMHERGHITERSAAAYKAHVTRRIVAPVAPVQRVLTPAQARAWESEPAATAH